MEEENGKKGKNEDGEVGGGGEGGGRGGDLAQNLAIHEGVKPEAVLDHSERDLP